MKTLVLITMLLASANVVADDVSVQSLYMMVLQAKSCLYDQSHNHADSRDCKLLDATAPDRAKFFKSLKVLDEYDRDLLEYKATQESV
jgi:hypothetical protein